MFTKPLLIALLAACGVNSSGATAEPPGGEQPVAPPDQPPQEEGQHFCCESVDAEAGKGNGCVTIGKEHIALCNNILYCGVSWAKEDGKVTCIQ